MSKIKTGTRQLRGWVIPPSKDITMRDILTMSEQAGCHILLHYNPRQREFVAYSLAKKNQRRRLRALLSAFPRQMIKITLSRS